MIAEYLYRDSLRGALWECKYRESITELDDPSIILPKALKSLAHVRAKEIQKLIQHMPVSISAMIVPRSKRFVAHFSLDNTAIGLGTYGWKYNTDIIRDALRADATLIDTAEGYGFGKVEREIKAPLRSYGQNSYTLIATKVARTHMTKQSVINAGRRSQDRLDRDIDLYQIHWPHPGIPIEETLEGMAVLREEGVIDQVGVCNFCAGQLVQAMIAARKLGFEIVSNQIRVNKADPGNTEFLTGLCKELGVFTIGYSPLGQRNKELLKNPVQSLRWVLNHVDCVIPATNNLVHLKQLFDGIVGSDS